MNQTASSFYRRLAVALAASVGLFIAGIVLLPDALPIFPAMIVPMWVTLFANQQYDARTRRVLWIALAAGVLALVAVVAILLAK